MGAGLKLVIICLTLAFCKCPYLRRRVPPLKRRFLRVKPSLLSICLVGLRPHFTFSMAARCATVRRLEGDRADRALADSEGDILFFNEWTLDGVGILITYRENLSVK